MHFRATEPGVRGPSDGCDLKFILSDIYFGQQKQLLDWGGGGDTVSDSILRGGGGTRQFFILTLHNFKRIAPPLLRGLCVSNFDIMYQQLF